ncbi:MAG: LysR family transcriptional regulator substrate-binding protein, partial [Burkholderiaceae bacterium]
LLAVLPEGHPLAKLRTVPAKVLAEYPLIMTHAGSAPVIMRMFSEAGVKPNVAHDLTQILSILEFVKRGQGISILASLVLPADYSGLVYRRIEPTSKRRVGLACLSERRLSPAASAFWKHARDYAGTKKGKDLERHVRLLIGR